MSAGGTGRLPPRPMEQPRSQGSGYFIGNRARPLFARVEELPPPAREELSSTSIWGILTEQSLQIQWSRDISQIHTQPYPLASVSFVLISRGCWMLDVWKLLRILCSLCVDMCKTSDSSIVLKFYGTHVSCFQIRSFYFMVYLCILSHFKGKAHYKLFGSAHTTIVVLAIKGNWPQQSLWWP